MTPAVIAVVGGECSGKTTLAQALAGSLPGICVPEYLRDFVAQTGRVPARAEQSEILHRQIEAEQAAADAAGQNGLGWVVSDSGSLMTAVYSVVYFQDPSLLLEALMRAREYVLIVWCDSDIPWVADANLRDGPEYRTRVHSELERLLSDSGLPWIHVAGSVPDRLAQVHAALNVTGDAGRR